MTLHRFTVELEHEEEVTSFIARSYGGRVGEIISSFLVGGYSCPKEVIHGDIKLKVTKEET